MTDTLTVQSGNIAGASGFSPTGAPLKVATDHPYITKDYLIKSFEMRGLGIDENDPSYADGTLDDVILSVSAWVNRYCGRWFDMQTIDETTTGFQVRPYNPQMVRVIMKNRPFSSINSIYIQVLQWFIQIQTTQSGYLQIFPDKGFYRIVPLLSTAGTGLGSPIPAAILDRVALGVLWTNYTFGFGTPLTGIPLTAIASSKQYQAPLGNRLWAPDQPFSISDDIGVIASTNYSVNYPNGLVTFPTYVPTGAVKVTATTNESIPDEIKQACKLLCTHLIGQALQNPLGAKSLSIQTFNVDFGENSSVEKRAMELLEPYNIGKLPIIMGM